MDIINGFIALFSDPLALLFVALGAVLGVIVGAIPGLTAAAAIAMLVPITYHLPVLPALAFLYVIGKSGRFGGSIAAILFNTPGTTASAATMIDGYPLTRQGKSGKALKMAALSSVFGDTGGELLLIFGAVHIAGYTEKLGPPEYFAVHLMAFIIIGSVIGKSILKGILSTLFGILVATIGLDPINAMPRFSFGIVDFESGLSLVPLLIGVFVLSEVLMQAEDQATLKGIWQAPNHSTDRDDNRVTWPEFVTCLPVLFRSTIIGSIIGMMPGLGSAVACFVAYGEEKRRAKRKDLWGKGVIEGVAAPESANNAVSGPSMIPLLTLGVPGSTIAAILVSVFLIHGVTVGPAIFRQDRDLIFGLFASGLLGIGLYGLIGYYGSPIVGRLVTLMPPRYIYPFIFLTAFIASYAARNSALDVVVMAIFGLIGYVMRKFDFNLPAFIISFVLTKGAEESLRQSLLLTEGGYLVFFERPFVLVCFALTILVVGFRVWGTVRHTRSEDYFGH